MTFQSQTIHESRAASRRDRGLGGFSVVAGASLDPNEAIQSAILEVSTKIAGLPEEARSKRERVSELLANPDAAVTVSDHGLLYANPEMADRISWFYGNPLAVSFQEAFSQHAGECARRDVAKNLRAIVERLLALPIGDICVVDQTTPELRALNLVAVRAIVPGLAPIDFGRSSRASSSPASLPVGF